MVVLLARVAWRWRSNRRKIGMGTGPSWPRGWWSFLLVNLAVTSALHAQELSGTVASAATAASDGAVGNPVGRTAWALPGIIDIGLPGQNAGGWLGLAVTSGYGFSESHGPVTGGHHRLIGSIAAGVTPVAGLDLALRLDGRMDTHPDDGEGSDSGYTGDPRLLIRYGKAMGKTALGAEGRLWIPGREAPSLAMNAATVDLQGLGAWMPSSDFTIAARLGYRVDKSGNARPDLMRTRPGDRTALGLSDFDAVLTGVGVAYRTGRSEWLGEATADVLLGRGAPGVGQSPIRVAAGVRHHLSGSWQLVAMVTALASRRVDLGPMDPLAPNEPRLTARIGMIYTPGGDRGRSASTLQPETPADNDGAPKAVDNDQQDPTSDPTEPPDPQDTHQGQLRGLVRSFSGAGLHATIELEPLRMRATTKPDGTFEIDVPPGRYRVKIKAAGFASQYRTVRVEENGVTILNAELLKR